MCLQGFFEFRRFGGMDYSIFQQRPNMTQKRRAQTLLPEMLLEGNRDMIWVLKFRIGRQELSNHRTQDAVDVRCFLAGSKLLQGQ